jgi:hypothetical protein
MARTRLHEIERLIAWRHDGRLPDTDDADLYLPPVALCILTMTWRRARAKPSLDQLIDRLMVWCEGRAPTMNIMAIRRAARDARRSARHAKADELAAAIKLTYAERTSLAITTIGACDANKAERARRYLERKREHDRIKARERRAKQRRRKGGKTRAEYLAGYRQKARPWEDEGVSRATWYRRLKAQQNCENAA